MTTKSTAAKPLDTYACRTLQFDGCPGTLAQPSIVVAAPSRAAAARHDRGRQSGHLGPLKEYGSVTGNREQVETAESAPGTVFVEVAYGVYEAVSPQEG